MLSKRQISKLVKRVYPTATYSKKERKQLRNILMQDILSYLDHHPNTSYDELITHYVDPSPIPEDEFSHIRFYIFVIITITLIIAIAYIILLANSNNWIPPTYHIYF